MQQIRNENVEASKKQRIEEFERQQEPRRRVPEAQQAQQAQQAQFQTMQGTSRSGNL